MQGSASSRLSLLVAFLNQNFSEKPEGPVRSFLGKHGWNNPLGRKRARTLQSEMRKALISLITIPDALVIRESTSHGKLKALSPGTRSALFSTYKGGLESLVHIINYVLKTDLTVQLGDHKLWRYQLDLAEPQLFFPLGSEIGELLKSRGKRPVINPTLRRQSNQGLGNIKTPRGKFIVEGLLSSLDASSPRKHLYWVLAKSCVTGRFSKLRACRSCQRFYLAGDIRKAFCLGCGSDAYGSYRMAKSRRNIKEKKFKERKQVSEIIDEFKRNR